MGIEVYKERFLYSIISNIYMNKIIIELELLYSDAKKDPLLKKMLVGNVI